MKREARDKSVIFMQLMTDEGDSGCVSVGGCSTTTLETTSASMKKGSSSCKDKYGLFGLTIAKEEVCSFLENRSVPERLMTRREKKNFEKLNEKKQEMR